MLGYSDASPLEGSDLIYRTLCRALQCLKAAVVPRATRAMSVNVFRQSELYLHIYLLEEQQWNILPPRRCRNTQTIVREKQQS